ncbi:hypothetical protein GDO81_012563 [Engystomops pustulosus]|uniref:Uncharacterized protein n=1 Tax=Engystomops pustulosus TaxID=76066 RepID=A0AAV7BMS9_ENGPU|nr:hypothetical protein GDO81_012563 [Engystomops pustulosus]
MSRLKQMSELLQNSFFTLRTRFTLDKALRWLFPVHMAVRGNVRLKKHMISPVTPSINANNSKLSSGQKVSFSELGLYGRYKEGKCK